MGARIDWRSCNDILIGVYSFFALKLSLDTFPIFDLTLIVHLLRNETCLSCSLEEIRKLSCLDDRSKNGLNEFYGKIITKLLKKS